MTGNHEHTYSFNNFFIDWNTDGQFIFYDENENWLGTSIPEDENEFDFHLQHYYDEFKKGEKTSFQIYTQLIRLSLKGDCQ